MRHPLLGYGVDSREGDAGWLVGFCGGFLLSLCLSFGFRLCLHGFGFAKEDFAEAGWASLLFDFFRVRALFGRADQGTVCVFVGFAHGLQGYCFFRGHEAPVAVVLRGYLQAVDEDPGAAGVDAVGGEGENYIGQGELDGVGVF